MVGKVLLSAVIPEALSALVALRFVAEVVDAASAGLLRTVDDHFALGQVLWWEIVDGVQHGP